MEEITPFGRYRLVDVLGRGGMGEVWRAFDTVTERVVAVKVLPLHLADDKLFQRRFLREAKAAASLNEPHVVPIYDFGEIDGRLFVAMRLVDGHDLQVLLAQGALDPGRAVAIIEQIASALDAAHRIGLIHRDVKPSNILLAEDDFAYLIDFGIARAAGETALTSTGSTIGTWEYMAPERFQHGQADASADIYALACVLYQALTGERPFPSKSLEQLAAAHMMKPPPRPSKLNSAVGAAMDAVIATGMAKELSQRYPTTKDLARASRAALTAPTQQLSQLVDSDTAATSQGAAEVPTQAGPTVSSTSTPTRPALVDAANDYGPATRLAASSEHAPVELPAGPQLDRSSKVPAAAPALIAVVLVALFVIVGVAILSSRSSTDGHNASRVSATTLDSKRSTPTGVPGALTSLPGQVSTKAWPAESLYIVELFPKLLPTTPDAKDGYQAATGCRFDSGKYAGMRPGEQRVACTGPYPYLFITCNESRTKFVLPELAPNNAEEIHATQWIRPSMSGTARYWTNVGHGKKSGWLNVLFDAPARTFCGVTVIGGDGSTGRSLYESWLPTAPL